MIIYSICMTSKKTYDFNNYKFQTLVPFFWLNRPERKFNCEMPVEYQALSE